MVPVETHEGACRLTAAELRAWHGLVMRLLADGHQRFVIVGDDGAPIGKLVPVAENRPGFTSAQRFLDAVARLPPLDYEQVRADLDAVADQDPTPRG